MRAARLHSFGQAPVVDDVDVPAREPGQTLVRIDAAALGHLDMTVASGNFDVRPRLPHIGGTDGAGTVVESDTFEPGPRSWCAAGASACSRTAAGPSSWWPRPRAFTPFDSGLDPAVAATFLLPSTTGYVAVHDVADVRVANA